MCVCVVVEHVLQVRRGRGGLPLGLPAGPYMRA